ncbi:MAG: hypothetical protein R3320_05615 [Nitriliruptorales bacterium]|nr:hypothetical protein [Nitriliruptorales bacterium]
MSTAPTPRRIVPLLTELGEVSGHRFILMSLEDWGDWCDLRFARVGIDAGTTLPRRIPPAHSWRVWTEDGDLTVEDAVGRGDRDMSIGEVRLRPGLPHDPVRIHIEVEVLKGVEPLRTYIDVPAPEAVTGP